MDATGGEVVNVEKNDHPEGNDQSWGRLPIGVVAVVLLGEDDKSCEVCGRPINECPAATSQPNGGPAC